MRAEDRHRLKTNELAQKLSELPEYLRKHSKIISIGVVSAVAICVVGGFWWSARKKAYGRQNDELQGLLPQITQVQNDAVQTAQDPEAQSEVNPQHKIATILGTLDNLSSEAKGTPVGMMALLQQADLKRSELYYSDRLLSDQEQENICRAAENLYNQILSRYPNYAQAVGMAKLGLALVAEDRGAWDMAKKTYEKIIAETDGKLAGTTFPLLAQRRLQMIDEIAVSIEFPYIEPEPEEQKEPEQTEADKLLFGSGKKIEPIRIEIPAAPVPKTKKDDTPVGPEPEDTEAEKAAAEPSTAPAPEPAKTTETDEKKEK